MAAQISRLTNPTRAALAILDPIRVVVVGGPLSISEATVAQLRTAAPHATVDRISGADRCAVSRAVVADAFHSPPTAVYLATGANFPDALTAGAVAGSNSSPVVLVDGGAPTLPGDTLGLLTGLGSRDLILVGGTSSISAGIEHAIPAPTPMPSPAACSQPWGSIRCPSFRRTACRRA
jgi:putative cell wall-binding protein